MTDTSKKTELIDTPQTTSLEIISDIVCLELEYELDGEEATKTVHKNLVGPLEPILSDIRLPPFKEDILKPKFKLRPSISGNRHFVQIHIKLCHRKDFARILPRLSKAYLKEALEVPAEHIKQVRMSCCSSAQRQQKMATSTWLFRKKSHTS